MHIFLVAGKHDEDRESLACSGKPAPPPSRRQGSRPRPALGQRAGDGGMEAAEYTVHLAEQGGEEVHLNCPVSEVVQIIVAGQ